MTLVTTGLTRSIRPIRVRNKPILWRTALQAEYSVYHYPGTPPPSVYQVTHGTALQAAECYVMHHSPYARCPFGTHLYGKPRYPGCRFAFPWAMSLQLLQGAW